MRGATVVEIFILHIRSHAARWFISPPHTLSLGLVSLVYLRSHRMAIHTQPLAPPILMHVQLDPVVIYGVLKKVSDFLRRGAPKIPRPCVFLPWFLIRSGLCRSIPLACWDSMGASTWGGGMEMQIRDEVCSLPLIYFRTDPKSISSVSNGGVDLGLFLCGICFWRFGHLALTIRWFSQPSEAHAQRSVGGIVGWNPMWAILVIFFCVVVSWGNGEGLFELAFGIDLFHLYRQIIIEFLIGWSAVLLFKQEGKEILHHLYLFLQFYYPNVVVINTYSVYATLLIYSLLKASVLIYSVIKQNPILLGTI